MIHIPTQAFSWIDVPLVILLILLEILLSADNAAAMALIAKCLKPQQRSKALFVGVATSFTFRIIGILVAAYLIQFFWVQIIGGLYLIYLAIKHIVALTRPYNDKCVTYSFWKAVFLIEMTDILFAVDSILAAFALAGLYYPFQILPSKLWVIYLGGIIGLFTMRFAAKGFMKLLDTYPSLEKMIFLIIGWMGLKLISEGIFTFFPESNLKQLFDGIFWLGSVMIFLIGFLSTKWDQTG